MHHNDTITSRAFVHLYHLQFQYFIKPALDTYAWCTVFKSLLRLAVVYIQLWMIVEGKTDRHGDMIGHVR